MEKNGKIKQTEEDYLRESMKREGYWITEWQLVLFDALKNYQKKNNLNQTELSEKLGVTKGYISQVLNGKFDHKVSTLIHLSLAIGKAPLLTFDDLETHIENELDGLNSLSGEEKIQYNQFKENLKIQLSVGGYEDKTVPEIKG